MFGDFAVALQTVVVVVIWLFFLGVYAVPFWKIFQRAGWSKWLSLLMIVPVLNLILLWIVAFKKWPIELVDVGDNND